MASGITRKDPLALGQEFSEGVLHVQDILTLSHTKDTAGTTNNPPRPEPHGRQTPAS